MLKQKFSQKLLQKLSPQQIQLMKLLQIPTATLEQRVKEEMEINPALEENDYEENTDPFANSEPESKDDNTDNSDEIDLSEYLNDDDIASYKLRNNNYSKDADDDNKTIPIAVTESFHENLIQQLGMVDMSERAYTIAQHIIGSIDDDGYLRRELEAIIDDLAFTQNITTDLSELEMLLSLVQSFEPAGVGARDLEECLLIQLRRKKYEEDSPISYAIQILENYFDEFSKKHYKKLCKQLSLNSEELKEVLDEILKLNPKPGGSFSANAKPENYIIPDFIIQSKNGDLHLSLNSRNAPDLRVSDNYRDMLKEYSKTKNRSRQQKEAVLFIKQKIDSAKWFIDAIKQRQATMLKTMQAILDYQYDYFLTGDELQMRPMILKDIAEITGLDISTVSRVSNSKYVQTEFGTFKLKSFFSESLQTDSGEEVSTREVKKILTQLIDRENKKKPLSDQKLTEALVEKGYNIARRTVAKYREQLGISVARLRKEL